MFDIKITGLEELKRDLERRAQKAKALEARANAGQISLGELERELIAIGFDEEDVRRVVQQFARDLEAEGKQAAPEGMVPVEQKYTLDGKPVTLVPVTSDPDEG